MSILTDIKAALEAKRVADTMLRAELDFRTTPRRIKARDEAQDNLHALLTDDTIASLVAVARAAAAVGCYTCVGLRDSQSAGWPCNEPAARLHVALAPLLEEVPDES